MYPSAIAAKSNAKNYLKGNFLSAIGVSMTLLAVVSLVSMLCSLIAVLFRLGDTTLGLSIEILHPMKLLGIFIFFSVTVIAFCTLIGPIYLGVFRWFWYLTADETLPCGQVFYYYSRGLFQKTVDFLMRFLVKFLIRILLFFSPYIITVTVSSPQLYRLFGGTVPLVMASLAPLTTLFSLVGAILTVLYLFQIYLLVPIICNDDNISIGEAFLLARHFSYYTAGAYFSFLLSFLGHFLLCLLGIPAIYSVPYFLSANAMYSRYALNYGIQINRFEKN